MKLSATTALSVCALCLCSSSLCWSADQKSKTLYETSFEGGGRLPKDWTVEKGSDKNFFLVDTGAWAGKRSLRIVDTSKQQSIRIRSPKVRVRPGQTVWVSLWYLQESGCANLGITFEDGRGKRTGKRAFNVCGRKQWFPTTVSFEAPAETRYARIVLMCGGKWTAEGCFDGLRVGIGTPPSPSTDKPDRQGLVDHGAPIQAAEGGKSDLLTSGKMRWPVF